MSRLVGGSVAEEGRVEVCRYGVWGTVCSNSWSVNDAKVVCGQLGYSTESKETITMIAVYSIIHVIPCTSYYIIAVFAYTEPVYGSGIDRIWLNNVNCNGSEDNLLDCMFTLNNGICDHSMDAGVKCIAGSKKFNYLCKTNKTHFSTFFAS